MRSEISSVKSKQAEFIKNQSRQQPAAVSHNNNIEIENNRAYLRETSTDFTINENNQLSEIVHDQVTRNNKKQQSTQSSHVRDRSPVDRLDVDNPDQPQHGYQLPPFAIQSGSGAIPDNSGKHFNTIAENNISLSNTISNNQSAVTLNPFIPPPIKSSLLKKIEKKEYIDFEELLPSSHSYVNNELINNTVIDVDLETKALKLRPHEKKEKIANLRTWMCAWNTFMQAYLHFKPDNFYLLFSYQKHFCRLASKYKFEACYMYDKDVRMLLASQASLPPSQRTVAWDNINQEVIHISQGSQVQNFNGTGQTV